MLRESVASLPSMLEPKSTGVVDVPSVEGILSDRGPLPAEHLDFSGELPEEILLTCRHWAMRWARVYPI